MPRDVVNTSYRPRSYHQVEYLDGTFGPVSSGLRGTALYDQGERDLVHQSNRVIPTNYYAHRCSQVPGPYREKKPRTLGGGWYHYWGHEGISKTPVLTSYYTPWNSISMTNQYNATIAQANAAAMNGDVSLGETIAEMPSTLDTLVDMSIRTLRGYRYARKGAFGMAAKELGFNGVRNIPKGIADYFLMWKFGIQPAIQDVYNTAQAVVAQLERPAHASVKRRIESEGPGGSYPGWSGEARERLFVTEVKYTYRIADRHQAALNALIDPLALPWQLLPLSFVVDWFVPISGFLSGIAAFAGLDFVGGYGTRYSRANFRFSKIGGVVNSAHIIVQRCEVDCKAEGFIREYLPSPRNRLYLKSPLLNSNQVAVLTALIAQRG